MTSDSREVLDQFRTSRGQVFGGYELELAVGRLIPILQPADKVYFVRRAVRLTRAFPGAWADLGKAQGVLDKDDAALLSL